MMMMLRLLSRMLLVEVVLQQTRQLLIRHCRRHRPPQRRLRMVIVEVMLVVVWVIVVVKVPEVLPQGAEAVDGRQGRRRQPGGGEGRQPVLSIARDSRGRGGCEGLVDVEGPETEWKQRFNLEHEINSVRGGNIRFMASFISLLLLQAIGPKLWARRRCS